MRHTAGARARPHRHLPFLIITILVLPLTARRDRRRSYPPPPLSFPGVPSPLPAEASPVWRPTPCRDTRRLSRQWLSPRLPGVSPAQLGAPRPPGSPGALVTCPWVPRTRPGIAIVRQPSRQKCRQGEGGIAVAVRAHPLCESFPRKVSFRKRLARGWLGLEGTSKPIFPTGREQVSSVNHPSFLFPTHQFSSV